MAQPYKKDDETVAGGCRAKDVHDEMRKDEIELPGEYTTTKKLMRPQTGEEVEG